MKIFIKNFLYGIVLVLIVLVVWQWFKTPATDADWQEPLAIASTATFDGEIVTVKNVRNFRYTPTEADIKPGYYDKTYDLSKIKKVWYVSEPFNESEYAAHTFLSFEFQNGDFLSITIEARKTKGQTYSTWKGLLRTYPLIYIASDERDVVLLRANIRKDNVFVYPVKTSAPGNMRILLVDMLNRMNDIQKNPVWYNTLFANCTSVIATHINKITPGRIPVFSWQLLLTGHADELALDRGLLDTDLSIQEARIKYRINDASERIGDVPDYSKLIREAF